MECLCQYCDCKGNKNNKENIIIIIDENGHKSIIKDLTIHELETFEIFIKFYNSEL